MSRRALLLVTTLTFIGCEQATAPTQAASRSIATPSFDRAGSTRLRLEIPVNTTVFNSCTNEDILVSGTEHGVQTTTTDGSTTTIDTHVNFQDITGVGLTSGTPYHLAAAAHQVQVTGTGSFSQDEVLNEEFISDGSAPNFLLKATETITFDGTTTTTTIKRLDMDCRG